MRDILVTAIVAIVLLMVFKHPHYGIYLWSWLSYMNPHKQTWGFAYDFQFAFLAAIVTMVAFLLSREPKRVIWAPEVILLILFNLWMVVTTIFAFYPENAWEQWDKVWKIQVMTLVTMMLITSRERINGLVWIIVISLGYYGVKGGIFTITTGGTHRVWGPEGTFIGGNNEIALALVMTIPLIRYLHLQAQKKWMRYVLAASMVLTAVAAIGSQSRGALLAIVAMGVFLWLKSRQKAVTGLYALIAVVAVLLVMPQSWYDRMDTIRNYEEDASATGRINAWYTAVNVAGANLTGGGYEVFKPDTFKQYAPNPMAVHDAHSVYFELLGEHGFIGLGLWLLIAFLAWRRASRTIKRWRDNPANKWAVDLSAMIQVSLIGFGVGGAFLGLAYFDLYYHLIALIILTEYAARTTSDKNVDAVQLEAVKPRPYAAGRWRA